MRLSWASDSMEPENAVSSQQNMGGFAMERMHKLGVYAGRELGSYHVACKGERCFCYS